MSAREIGGTVLLCVGLAAFFKAMVTVLVWVATAAMVMVQ